MDQNTKKMYDILNKLNSVDTTSKIVAERAESDVELEMAITQKVTDTSVSVQNYRIDIVLQEFAGKQKRFYNVVDGNKIIYRELGLFETAMGIVKNLMLGKSSKVQELVTHDNSYMDNLYEVYMHNTRIKRGTVNEDVAVAKLSKAKSKVAEAKSKILKRL
tara:strand:+ start:1673 stop:2155 length:483 start_codon:yes stop_codon:yes gene_type:complete